MLITTILCSLLTLAYVLLMLAYRRGWAQQQEFIIPPTYIPHTRITIIIPARNEATNIGACIDAILAQVYPTHLFEVIVVDDHSDDDTASIVHEYTQNHNVRCINLADFLAIGSNTNAYKKAAITAGITYANGELIVTTDADCTAPNAWLMHLAAIYEQQTPVMIVGPVIFTTNNTILQLFQLTDFMSMQGITAAAHQLRLGNMSNGANLAFSKAAFGHVGGYEGITHLASGDDYLLMMKMAQHYPTGITYLRSARAVVSTAPQLTWQGFIQQRIRWASKSGKYSDPRLTSILLLVYLFNVSFLFVTIAALFHTPLFFPLFAMFVVKVTAEYYYLAPVARFFRKVWLLKYFLVLQPLHIAYIITAGFLGFFGSYKWKGRNVR